MSISPALERALGSRLGKSINNAAASRRGNHRLKNALFLAAFVATQHDPHARAYYFRKRAEGKNHNAAVICVARRCPHTDQQLVGNQNQSLQQTQGDSVEPSVVDAYRRSPTPANSLSAALARLARAKS